MDRPRTLWNPEEPLRTLRNSKEPLEETLETLRNSYITQTLVKEQTKSPNWVKVRRRRKPTTRYALGFAQHIKNQIRTIQKGSLLHPIDKNESSIFEVPSVTIFLL